MNYAKVQELTWGVATFICGAQTSKSKASVEALEELGRRRFVELADALGYEPPVLKAPVSEPAPAIDVAKLVASIEQELDNGKLIIELNDAQIRALINHGALMMRLVPTERAPVSEEV